MVPYGAFSFAEAASTYQKLHAEAAADGGNAPVVTLRQRGAATRDEVSGGTERSANGGIRVIPTRHAVRAPPGKFRSTLSR